MSEASAWEEVYEIVRLIPPGRVMNYGQIAGLCGRPLTPRAVGWAMHDCPPDVPWHRVVNAQGVEHETPLRSALNLSQRLGRGIVKGNLQQHQIGTVFDGVLGIVDLVHC